MAKRDVRRGVMPLNHDGAWFQAEAASRVFIRLALISPVADLPAVDPSCHMWALCDDRLVEPGVVVRNHTNGVLAAKDAARATVSRFVPISPSTT